MTFITVFAGGIAIEAAGWEIWFWQLGSCILAIPFVYFMCPESKFPCIEPCPKPSDIILKHLYREYANTCLAGGKSLEEVDLVFMDKAVRVTFVRQHEEFRAEQGESTASGKEGADSSHMEKV